MELSDLRGILILSRNNTINEKNYCYKYPEAEDNKLGNYSNNRKIWDARRFHFDEMNRFIVRARFYDSDEQAFLRLAYVCFFFFSSRKARGMPK